MITRTELIEHIEQHLAGTIDAAKLAAWAFDRFYALELAADTIAEQEAELIGEVLDELMFADDPAFALEEADLRRLIMRLQQL